MISTTVNIESIGLQANVYLQLYQFKPLREENDQQCQNYLTITCMKTGLSKVRRHHSSVRRLHRNILYVMSCEIELFTYSELNSFSKI